MAIAPELTFSTNAKVRTSAETVTLSETVANFGSRPPGPAKSCPGGQRSGTSQPGAMFFVRGTASFRSAWDDVC